MPKQLNNGQITQALQRAFGFKGRYIPMLDEVIVPVYNIADPSPASVTRLVAGTFDAFSNTTEIAYVQLFNPVGSGVIANLTTTVALSDVKQGITVRFFDTPAPLKASVGPFFRDRRNVGNPICELRRDETELLPVGDEVALLQVDGALAQTAAWAAETADPRQPLAVLGPGQGIVLQPQVNVASSIMRVNFRWLEIPITEVGPIGGLP